MPVRMVPDARYEIIEIQYFILRGAYYGAYAEKAKAELSKAFDLLSKESKFKIRTFYTGHYVAQNFPGIKNPGGFSDFHIVWHYVFKNPDWDRFIRPTYYAHGGGVVSDHGKSPFLLKSYLATAFEAPNEKIKKTVWRPQQPFMLWFNASMSLFG